MFGQAQMTFLTDIVGIEIMVVQHTSLADFYFLIWAMLTYGGNALIAQTTEFLLRLFYHAVVRIFRFHIEDFHLGTDVAIRPVLTRFTTDRLTH